MILNFIQILGMTLNLNANEPLKTCEAKKIAIIGHYGAKGENKSPLLDTWSEVSGEIKNIEFKSKDKIQNMKLFFLDEQQKEILQKKLTVSNNKVDSLNLIQNYKIELAKTKTLKLILESKNTDLCQSEITIIQADGEGPNE